MPGSFAALFNLLCLWLPITSKNAVGIQVLYRKKMISLKELKDGCVKTEIKSSIRISFVSYKFLHTKSDKEKQVKKKIHLFGNI